MKVFSILRVFVVLHILFHSFLGYAVEPRDFIFVAEIPTYAPFRAPLSLEELQRREHEKSQATSRKEFQRQNYVVTASKDDSKQWRGQVSLKTPNLENPDQVLNYQQDEEHISSVVSLFRNEAFGTTSAESQEECATAMKLVLLANRMESLFEVKNESLGVPHHHPDTLVLQGTWKPSWSLEKKKVQVTEVRLYLHLCLATFFDPDASEDERSLASQEINRLIEQEDAVSGHVPYHELRELLRHSPRRDEFVQTFVDSQPTARLYEASHDSDLVSLRLRPDGTSSDVSPTGLYTHYQTRLRAFLSQEHRLPNVLTTGYRFTYEAGRFGSPENFAWIYAANEEERYLKASFANEDFRATYVSEPNCLFLVPVGSIFIPQSYLELPDGKSLSLTKNSTYAPCESLAIMRRMYTDDQTVALDFDPTHPVMMKIPPRMLKDKNSKTPLKTEDLGTYEQTTDSFDVSDFQKLLLLPSKISQSGLSFKNYATTLYRQLGLYGKSRQLSNLFRSLIVSIFNYYNIELDGQGNLEPQKRLSFTRYLDKNSNPGPKKVFIVNEIKAIHEHPTVTRQLRTLATFMNNYYGDGIGNLVITLGQKMRESRLEHYNIFFRGTPEQKLTRTSPSQAIAQSPPTKKKKLVLEIVKEEPTPVKKDLRHAFDEAIAGPSEVKETATGPSKSADEFLIEHFQQSYSRDKVTPLVSLFTLQELATKAKIGESTVSKLKKLKKYGSLHPSAKKVWALFHNKETEDLLALGLNKNLEDLARDLGYE